MNDKNSQGECEGFDLQRVPTTSTVSMPKETRAPSKTRRGSQTKSDRCPSGTPAPASAAGRPKIEIISPVKSSDKKAKLLEFRQGLKKKIESGEHYGQDLKDIHQSQQEKEILDNVLKLGGSHP